MESAAGRALLRCDCLRFRIDLAQSCNRLTRALFGDFMCAMSSEEYSTCRRMVHREDHVIRMVTRIALRSGIHQMLNRHEEVRWNEIDIARTEKGKPYVASHVVPFSYNLSDDNGQVVVVTCCAPRVGVDTMCAKSRGGDAIERVRKLRRQFALHEYNNIVECSTPEETSRTFMRYWTLKEAYLKMTGEGISTDLSKVSFHVGAYEKRADVKGNEVSVCTSTRRDCADASRELYDEELCSNFVTAVCREATDKECIGNFLFEQRTLIECIPSDGSHMVRNDLSTEYIDTEWRNLLAKPSRLAAGFFIVDA